MRGPGMGVEVKFNTCLLLFLALIHSTIPKYSQRTVKTAYGELRGIVYPKGGNLVKDVEAFLGVPYASAPAASLRFMPPLTPSRWTGVRIAEKMGPVCPQILPPVSNRTEALEKMPLLKFTKILEMLKTLQNQSEDCLYLNIYMPHRESRGRGLGEGSEGEGGLAIAVLLQGESWEWGSGALIDGSPLAAYGHLIVITLNYRLNVLGFLQTASQQGNYALMDVVAALHWIRENAGAFGGDVNRVTLVGHRTGAVLANFLMMAPVASELFHRVVLLSGSALSPWSFQRHSKSNVRKLAEQLKCWRDKATLFAPLPQPHSGGPAPKLPPLPQESLPDVGPCLRLVPGDELLSSVDHLIAPRFLSRFGPLIDSSVVKADFVSEMKADTAGRFSRFPLLLGMSSIEAFAELNTEDVEDGLSEGKRDRVLRTFVRNVFVYHLNEIYSTIRNEYTDWEKPRRDYMDTRDEILQILSDGLTVAPLIQVASMHSQKANAKTFLFHLQYEAEGSVYPNRIGSISEDLLDFTVGSALPQEKIEGRSSRESLPYSSNDARVSRGLMHYLANFIISGDPNSGYDGSSVEDAQLPFWDSYDPINQFYLEIGSVEPRMKSHYRGHKMALWLNLIPQLHQFDPDVAMLHNNFRDERPESYEGVVREQSKHHPPGPEDALSYPAAGFVGTTGGKKEAPATQPLPREGEEEGEEDYEGEPVPQGKYPTMSPGVVMSTSECPPNTTGNATEIAASPGTPGDRDLVRQLAAAHYHSYGTALGVTIGVGCCLLLLNLLIFLAIYHQKTHNPVPGPDTPKDHQGLSLQDEENPPLHLPRTRSQTEMRYGTPHLRGASASVPALYNDEEGTDFDDDIVRELRECGGRRSHAHSHTSFRSNLNKEQSSSSGFSSPSIPDPPPPPRATFASLNRGSVRVLKSERNDFCENGTC